MSEREPGRRIVIVGSTGAGKTTLARQLAEQMGCVHVEMDALHWEPGWVEAEVETFRERARAAVTPERWVMDGNYRKVRDIVWGAADTLVWLDYSLTLVLWRLWWRTLRRIFSRQELWNGNRERFSEQFFSKRSIFLWALQTHGKRRQEFPPLLQRPEYAHLTVIHLRTPRETERWLREHVNRRRR